jgi:hypothetical protein
MKLSESLERRASRGPHLDPDAVIAAARERSGRLVHVDADHRIDPSANVADLYLGTRIHPTHRRRPIALLVGVAAVTALFVAAGFTALATRNDATTDAADRPSAQPVEPIGPLAISDRDRDAAIQNCAQGRAGATGIVDSRPGGVLVGVLTADEWSTCLFANDSLSNDLGPGPAALTPTASPDRPIVVIDAKSPEGNQINGDELVWVWGRVDPSIATVVVSTPTAAYTPTIADGLFAAWWPGNNGDQTVVRGFDANGDEVAFVDQLNCTQSAPVDVPGVGLFTPTQPRLVVKGKYLEGGCIGGENVEVGTSPDAIGD